MKILKQGTKLLKRADKIFLSECWHCGCVFEFKGDEIQCYDNIKTLKTELVHCPQCSTTNTEWKEKII